MKVVFGTQRPSLILRDLIFDKSRADSIEWLQSLRQIKIALAAQGDCDPSES